MTPVDVDMFDKYTAKLEEIWKTQIARRGSEVPNVWHVPWGSPELDWATFGGAPFGRWTRLFGAWSSGKSLATFNLIRSAQHIHLIAEDLYPRLASMATEMGRQETAEKLKRDRENILKRFPDGLACVYYNAEGTFEPDYAEALGIDVDALRIVDGNEMEKVVDALESYMGAAHCHFLDSTTSCIPIRMLKSETPDEARSVDAARWKDLLRRVETRFDPDENMFVYVSHTTVNQRTQAEEPVGGRKLNFSSSLSLHLRHATWVWRSENGILVNKTETSNTISGLTEPDGIEITARVAKSRVCPPFRTARMRLDFSQGGRFDIPYEISEAAKFYDMIGVGGGGWFYPLDENGERTDEKFQSEFRFREWIDDNPEFRERVRARMMLGKESRAGDVPVEPDQEEEQVD